MVVGKTADYLVATEFKLCNSGSLEICVNGGTYDGRHIGFDEMHR